MWIFVAPTYFDRIPCCFGGAIEPVCVEFPARNAIAAGVWPMPPGCVAARPWTTPSSPPAPMHDLIVTKGVPN